MNIQRMFSTMGCLGSKKFAEGKIFGFPKNTQYSYFGVLNTYLTLKTHVDLTQRLFKKITPKMAKFSKI